MFLCATANYPGLSHSCCCVQISLVDPPELSYALILQGGDITFLPGLEVFINSIIKDAVLRPFVWPDGYTIPLAPGGGREVRPQIQIQIGILLCQVKSVYMNAKRVSGRVASCIGDVQILMSI